MIFSYKMLIEILVVLLIIIIINAIYIFTYSSCSILVRGGYHENTDPNILAEKSLGSFDNRDVYTDTDYVFPPDQHFNKLFINFAYERGLPKRACMQTDRILYDSTYGATIDEIINASTMGNDIKYYEPDVYIRFTRDLLNYALFIEFDDGGTFHTNSNDLRNIKKNITYNKILSSPNLMINGNIVYPIVLRITYPRGMKTGQESPIQNDFEGEVDFIVKSLFKYVVNHALTCINSYILCRIGTNMSTYLAKRIYSTDISRNILETTGRMFILYGNELPSFNGGSVGNTNKSSFIILDDVPGSGHTSVLDAMNEKYDDKTRFIKTLRVYIDYYMSNSERNYIDSTSILAKLAPYATSLYNMYSDNICDSCSNDMERLLSIKQEYTELIFYRNDKRVSIYDKIFAANIIFYELSEWSKFTKLSSPYFSKHFEQNKELLIIK